MTGKAVLLKNFPPIFHADLHLLKLQAHLQIFYPKTEGTIYNSPHSTILVSSDLELANHKNVLKSHVQL